MDKELKELAEKAGVTFQDQDRFGAFWGATDEQLAEFAALVLEWGAKACAARRGLATATLASNTFPDDERWTEGYAHGSDSCEAALLQTATRWRSVIPKEG